jgi:hypothetical protein
MTDESANLPSGGSKTVEPSTDIDNPENLNFWEPGDEEREQANPQGREQGINPETDEIAGGDQETGANADEELDLEATGEEPEAGDPNDELVVTIKGGEQVPVKELKLGYMRERDYRTKTQEVANRGRNLETMSTSVSNTARAIADFLANQLPDEPQTILAVKDPAEYTRQKAIYDSAMTQVSQIIELAQQPQQVSQQLTKEQTQERLNSENAELLKTFPKLADPKARQTFFNNAFETAAEFGYSQEETAKATDHRLFKMVHYARLGLKAEKDRRQALEKVNNAPNAVPRARATGPAAAQARQNQTAMKRLDQTGSIKDAMSIDFE